MAAICDPVVTAFPAIMDDPPLRVMMHRLWGTHFSALSPDLRRTILSSSHAKALDASPTEVTQQNRPCIRHHENAIANSPPPLPTDASPCADVPSSRDNDMADASLASHSPVVHHEFQCPPGGATASLFSPASLVAPWSSPDVSPCCVAPRRIGAPSVSMVSPVLLSTLLLVLP